MLCTKYIYIYVVNVELQAKATALSEVYPITPQASPERQVHAFVNQSSDVREVITCKNPIDSFRVAARNAPACGCTCGSDVLTCGCTQHR